MTYLLLQAFLLLLASYFLGAFVACVAKKLIVGSTLEPMPAGMAAREAVLQPAVVRTPATVSAPITQRVAPTRPIAPPPIVPRQPSPPQLSPQPPRPPQRGSSAMQPMIETGRRPEPRVAQKMVDPSRFERALFGPDANEGVPRRAIVELCPAVLQSVTGPPLPWPPPPKPVLPPTVLEPAVLDNATKVDVALEAKPASSALSGAAAAAAKTATAAAAAFGAAKSAATAVAKSVMAPRKDTSAADAENTESAAAAESVPSKPTKEKVEAAVANKDAQETISAPPPPKPAPAPRHKFDTSGGDDLQRIRAIDADTERRLKELGVAMFDTIAGWTPADINRVNQALGFTDRIDREQWVEQAQILAKGGETYYSRNRAAAMKAAAAAASTAATKVVPVPTPVPAAPEPKTVQPVSSAPAAATAKPVASSLPTPAAAKPSAQSEGKSVADMAAAAAAAIAAASASVTRGIRPIEPISPLSRVDPNIAIPARLKDAIKEREAQSAAAKQAVPTTADAEIDDTETDENGDDLKRIRGIGVLIAKRLVAMGVTRYEHIANWNSGDIDRVSQVLDFKGRIEREGWVEQARILASGGDTEFSRRVDRGDDDSSRDG